MSDELTECHTHKERLIRVFKYIHDPIYIVFVLSYIVREAATKKAEDNAQHVLLRGPKILGSS